MELVGTLVLCAVAVLCCQWVGWWAQRRLRLYRISDTEQNKGKRAPDVDIIPSSGIACDELLVKKERWEEK